MRQEKAGRGPSPICVLKQQRMVALYNNPYYTISTALFVVGMSSTGTIRLLWWFCVCGLCIYIN